MRNGKTTPPSTPTGCWRVMQKGNATHAQQAIAAARNAFPKWSRTPWQERVKLVRKAASLIEQRIFDLGAAMALEVGKNRMESLGDVQETADLMYYSATDDGTEQGLRQADGQGSAGRLRLPPTFRCCARTASG